MRISDRYIAVILASVMVLTVTFVFVGVNKADALETTTIAETTVVEEKVTEETIDLERFMAEINSAMPCETVETEEPTESSEDETEAVETTILEVTEETEEPFVIPIYSVDGCVLDEQLQVELYTRLSEVGAESFYEYALCQAYQESRFNTYAEAKNGMDKGLFQFRNIYWSSVLTEVGLGHGDIFDPYTQIFVYSRLVAKRLNARGDIWYSISDHFTGGNGYSQKYVNEVIQWYPTLRREN